MDKEAGSIIATNLCPLKDMSRYIPPLMHVIMGLTNVVLKELKNHVTKAVESERGSVIVDVHHKTELRNVKNFTQTKI